MNTDARVLVHRGHSLRVEMAKPHACMYVLWCLYVCMHVYLCMCVYVCGQQKRTGCEGVNGEVKQRDRAGSPGNAFLLLWWETPRKWACGQCKYQWEENVRSTHRLWLQCLCSQSCYVEMEPPRRWYWKMNLGGDGSQVWNIHKWSCFPYKRVPCLPFCHVRTIESIIYEEEDLD